MSPIPARIVTAPDPTKPGYDVVQVVNDPVTANSPLVPQLQTLAGTATPHGLLRYRYSFDAGAAAHATWDATAAAIAGARLLAAGSPEKTGNVPHVRLWDLQDGAASVEIGHPDGGHVRWQFPIDDPPAALLPLLDAARAAHDVLPPRTPAS